MKAFKAVYRHGKLYDLENNKRILIKEDGMLNLLIDDNQLMQEDPYNKPLQGKNSEELKLEIENKKYHSFKLLAQRDENLVFKIKAGKNTETKKYSMECSFKLRLLSDMYLFQKTKETIYGLIYPCACVVEEASASLKNFEPVYAYSLNDAYMKTYDFYFSLFGKPTANIYNHFWLIQGDKKTLLSKLRMY
jgi:hypothetical protein